MNSFPSWSAPFGFAPVLPQRPNLPPHLAFLEPYIRKYESVPSHPTRPRELISIIIEDGTVDELVKVYPIRDQSTAFGFAESGSSWYSYLDTAVRSNRIDMVNALLDLGEPIDQVDGRGYGTSLLLAAELGRDDILRLLLERGSQALEISNGMGETPILAAARNAHLSTVELLFQLGANPSARTRIGDTIYHCTITAVVADSENAWKENEAKIQILELLTRLGIPGIETPNNVGRTPLHESSRFGDTRRTETILLVRTVLKLALNSSTRGASLNALDTYEQTPLDCAILVLINSVSDQLRWYAGEEENFELVLPPELLEVINLFRSVGAISNYYISPTTGEVAIDRITDRILGYIGIAYDEDQEPIMCQIRDAITVFLQTPLTEEEIANNRYSIFFNRSQVSQLLTWL